MRSEQTRVTTIEAIKAPTMTWQAGRACLLIGDDLCGDGLEQDRPHGLLKAAQKLRRLADELSHAAKHGASLTA